MRNLQIYQIVTSAAELEEYAAQLLPQLLERATTHTKRFLRETGHWENNVVHDKLAQRWGYELVERFLVTARGGLPCRPIQLLDSFVLKHYSRPHSCCLAENPASTIGRFLDGLLSRAVHSRDAMTAIFYHLYGLGQVQVAKILALGPVESQRVYKNYMRWRSSGWSRMVEEEGLKEAELGEIIMQKRRHPVRFHREVERLMHRLQSHYRKSEPSHYPCLSRSAWRNLYDQDYGRDYRSWHLPFCQRCLAEVWDLRQLTLEGEPEPKLDVRIHPLAKSDQRRIQLSLDSQSSHRSGRIECH